MKKLFMCFALLFFFGCDDYGLNLPMEVDPADPIIDQYVSDESVEDTFGDVGVLEDMGIDEPDAHDNPLGVETFGLECIGAIVNVQVVENPEPSDLIKLTVRSEDNLFSMDWYSEDRSFLQGYMYDLETPNFQSVYMLDSGFWAADTDEFLVFFRNLEQGYDVMLPVDGYLSYSPASSLLIVQARLYTFEGRGSLSSEDCLDVEFLIQL